MLLLNGRDLEELVDLDDLRFEMRAALHAVSLGDAINSHRAVLNLPAGAVGLMASEDLNGDVLGFKAVAVVDAPQSGLNPHRGFVMLLRPTGKVEALIEASTLTALRTAAVSAAATEMLARRSSRRLAVIGTGRQAFEHVRALLRVRPISEVHVFGRRRSSAEAVAAYARTLGIKAAVADSVSDALLNADIVVSCTASRSPLFHINALARGAHLNAIGACRPGMFEVEIEDIDGLSVFVDSTQACEREAEELTLPLSNGRLTRDRLAGEIGTVTGSIERSNSMTTVFKSVGLGVQDLYAARYFLSRAKRIGLGAEVDF